MPKPLGFSIFPWTESDFGQAGYILSVRNPYTGERGQGFYHRLCDACRAYRWALHRFNSGENPLAYLDTPYVPEP